MSKRFTAALKNWRKLHLMRALPAILTTAILIQVNCGALTDNLLENKLFGHVKGAFTDAHQNKADIFEKAFHGAVFLDQSATAA